MSSKIEDYALLGDCETAALVARDGSIDWLCWPRFDSCACFAALLGGPEHGRWLIRPLDLAARVTRRYRTDTLILETDFETVDGAVTLIDFLPPRGKTSDVVRMIVGRYGHVTMLDAGKWSPAVRRSLITLKALTYRPSGGIVAAPTMSLPEQLGGSRNWDYRFCWLRDATFTLLALMNAGYYDEAQAWEAWLLRAVAGQPSQVQIMYGLLGERRLMEWEIPWLPGYEGSKPVRIGNAAVNQLQLDIFGEVMDALHQGRSGKLVANELAWAVQRALLEHLETIWDQPDEGIWEMRSGRRQFTYSKMMAWVAFDRAIKSVEKFSFEGPVGRWCALRGRIHDEICGRAFDPTIGAFMQSYGSKNLDAGLLLIPTVGFLPPHNPRVRSTIAAIERHLTVDGLVRRYDTADTRDGLPPGEGFCLACSFWLADSFFLTGRREEARQLFERLLTLRNDVGLLSEEYDPHAKRLVGNFPYALSHIALVNTAHNLARSEKPARQRSGAPSH
jgi:GH15 family glucan-1,4-alpha-glucosidase